MFTVFPEPHSTSNFLLVSLFYSSFSDTYYNLLHIFPHLLLLPATSNFSSLTPLSSTFLHVLLPVYHDATRLFPLSFGIYTFSSFNTKSPSICYSSSLHTFTPTFFISSTTLTTFLFLLLAIFIFSNISTSGSSINTSDKLWIQ